MVLRSNKEFNSLISKGMLNYYLNSSYWEKTVKQIAKKLVSRSVFDKLQLTHISLNSKTFCCNLKIRGLGAKSCLAFLSF